MSERHVLTRRGLVLKTPLVAGAAGLMAARPWRAFAMSGRPQFTHGIQTGDVIGDKAVLWARADRPARLMVEWSTTESFARSSKVMGPATLDVDDYTARVTVDGLPDGQRIFWRASFVDLQDINAVSEPVTGRFRTRPTAGTDVSFAWSGDTCGQGWGINPDFGGMKIYEEIRKAQPDFFIHSGDTIYADGPIKAEVALPDGTTWRNVTLEGKHKVAETLDEYRAAYRYNLMDANVRAMNLEVPTFFQWDDHETTNNWYPQEVIAAADERYAVKSAALLSARARRAFLDYAPIMGTESGEVKIHRHIPYGPMLDVFFLDMRSFRGPNTANLQDEASDETAFLGQQQIRWLKQRLLASRATWKVIAADMPIGLQVPDGKTAEGIAQWEAVANGDMGAPKGRELEIAGLLAFIKANDVKNVVWLTADVHYTAAHYYNPEKAKFTDFKPFWEFVSGPLNAGTFGPNALDDTFGPELKYVKAPEEGQVNLPPSDGMQFFGHVRIDGKTEVMTVTLMDIAGDKLWATDLTPEA
ncbi:alkaline phosphatase D family protein [Zavarzinia compransoris]|uniref:alkaline phosphatase D family protein n=1 Tax=Zavarzinia marina TaxID=2911065 RepID=UPI001F259DDD|nr:alkaline phosphatase D family protein [Zavarzinia marina]MCF4167740.1 alkaline phosphatase D family protein [Zavarzinia marina]